MKIQSSKGGNMDTYESYSTTSSSGDPGVVLAGLIGGLIALIVLYVIFSYFLGKIFKKAGEEPWKAWVPIYNQWVFLELGGQQGWLALLTLLGIIPFIGWIGSVVSFVFACIAAYHIGRKFQKEDWFVILYILVSPVWIIWLAVDSSTWKGATPVAAGAPTPPPYQPAAPQAPVTKESDQDSTPPTAPIAS